MIIKRLFDLIVSSLGIILLAPIFIIVVILIKLDSVGSVFFLQERVGLEGMPFKIIKFRTMIDNAEQKGKQITVGKDFRITRVGSVLRKYKIDELPQLFNVFLGEMSLVGPRPEVPRYVMEYTEYEKKIILSVLPGITDNASINFYDENEILGRSENPEETYIKEILPIKINYYIQYVKNQNFWSDFKIIIKTIFAIIR